MMQLTELLPELQLPKQLDNPVLGLSQDSRAIKSAYVFIALNGVQFDGHQFIGQAVQKGASAIFVNTDKSTYELVDTLQSPTNEKIPVIAIPQLASQLGILAARFYQYPSQQLTLIGVTGTNGKTSCTHFIAKVLQQLSKPCGVIGTVGYGFPNQLKATTHTTPDSITLQQWLAELLDEGAQAVAMEVSSHALAQQRVQAAQFKIAILTNLTRDHLDYHGDMAVYAAAKQTLFQQPDLEYAIINADDAFGVALLSQLDPRLKTYIYTTQYLPTITQNYPSICASKIQLTEKGLQALLITPWGEGILHTQLLGRFNLSNLLAVVTTLGILGYALSDILAAVTQLQGVVGRMELVSSRATQPSVVIDYAHTPDALEQVLLALREHNQGKLWCVFGCGGDRDRGKRPLMGQIAEQYADVVIVTNDNPRHEEPIHIVSEILAGFKHPDKAIVIHDRTHAIEHALQCANSNDMVLIAGKGHETYQQIGDGKLPFSDALVVKRWLAQYFI